MRPGTMVALAKGMGSMPTSDIGIKQTRHARVEARVRRVPRARGCDASSVASRLRTPSRVTDLHARQSRECPPARVRGLPAVLAAVLAAALLAASQ